MSISKKSFLILTMVIAIVGVFIAPNSASAKSNYYVITHGGCNTTSDYHLRVGACISRVSQSNNADTFTPDAYISYYQHTDSVKSCTFTITLFFSYTGGGGGVAGQTSPYNCFSDATKGAQNVHYTPGGLGNSNYCPQNYCSFDGEVEVSIYYTNGTSDRYVQDSPSMAP
ncbi:MAG TPA: hypothetical protein VII61_12020 [Ktedonobacteraceae bacterium]|jgi:hypothetical protein